VLHQTVCAHDKGGIAENYWSQGASAIAFEKLNPEDNFFCERDSVTGQTFKIPYDDWMKATDVRMSRRSSAMKKLDTEIENYETGIKDFYKNATPYQQMSLLKGNTVGIKYTETWH
jgi:hypothetical protein